LSGVPDDTNGLENLDGSDGPDDLVGSSRAKDLDGFGRAELTNLTGMTVLYGSLG